MRNQKFGNEGVMKEVISQNSYTDFVQVGVKCEDQYPNPCVKSRQVIKIKYKINPFDLIPIRFSYFEDG